MEIEKKASTFLQFIRKYQLLKEEDRLLLAVSGGVDSVTMGWLVHKLELPFAVAHCNFRLRGEESEGDERFVRELAARWGVKVYTAQFDTLEYARQKGLSLQMAARELRYSFFEQIRQNEGFNKIATAHHVNDAFETILINLSHGTGFKGLMGITPGRGAFIRPMLAFTGAEVREIAKEMKLEWRDDASNAKTDYERNKLRHQVVPVLEQLNPSLAATAKETLERLWATGALLQEDLKKWEEKHVQKNAGAIEISLEGNDSDASVLLYESIRNLTGLGYRSYLQLAESITQGVSGKLFYTDTHVINLDRGRLLIAETEEKVSSLSVTVSETETEVNLPGATLKISSLASPVAFETNPKIALLDAAKLTFPLVVRSWQQGDSFTPLGMKGQKKLSDFMIDSKIPVNLKKEVLVLTSGEKVAWIIGHRIDDRFKITSNTSKVLKLELC